MTPEAFQVWLFQGLSEQLQWKHNQDKLSHPKSKGQPRQLWFVLHRFWAMLRLFTKPAVPHLDQAWHDLSTGCAKGENTTCPIKPDPEVVKTIQCNLKPGSQGDSGRLLTETLLWVLQLRTFIDQKWQTLKATSLVMHRWSYLMFFHVLENSLNSRMSGMSFCVTL